MVNPADLYLENKGYKKICVYLQAVFLTNSTTLLNIQFRII